MLRIKEHLSETPFTKTIRFEESMVAVAGQFVMVWVPGVDEFPMSLSYHGDMFGFTYQIVGEGTKALSAMKPGSAVGIRGPYGNGFGIHGKKLLMVGGGTGMAPIAPFVEDAVEHGATVHLICGARTSAELLFEVRSGTAGAKVHVATDDGTKGFRGLATGLAETVLAKEKFDCIYACGPEKMVTALMAISKDSRIPMQASLERLMKCGIGICDSCAIDGKHVCRDGPVFGEKDLFEFEDLGRAKRDPSGRKVEL